MSLPVRRPIEGRLQRRVELRYCSRRRLRVASVEHLHRLERVLVRSLPTSDSFLRMSLVAVMMWQPISSAWKTFSSSRGLAQSSSAFGSAAQDRQRLASSAARDRRRCRRCGRRRPRRSPGVVGASASPTARTWSSVKIAVTLSTRPRCDRRLDQRAGELALGIGDGNLDVDVLAPGRDLARLLLHLVEVVGEHLERDRTVRNRFAARSWANAS